MEDFNINVNVNSEIRRHLNAIRDLWLATCKKYDLLSDVYQSGPKAPMLNMVVYPDGASSIYAVLHSDDQEGTEYAINDWNWPDKDETACESKSSDHTCANCRKFYQNDSDGSECSWNNNGVPKANDYCSRWEEK